MNNQNQLSGLDPKLAERFHQVMNTPTPGAAAPVVTTQTQPQNQTMQPLQPLWTPPKDLSFPQPTQAVQIDPQETRTPIAPIVFNQSSAMHTVPEPTPQTQNPISSQPIAQAPTENVINVPTQAAPPAPQTADTSSQVFSNKKKAGKISSPIVILGVVVFLLIYTLVWIKIFNVSLPFLP